MIELFAPKTSCGFDNLRQKMREAFYTASLEDWNPYRILCGVAPLVGYEGLLERSPELDSVTTFKGIPMVVDRTVPNDEMRFVARDGEIIAVIKGIS